MNKIRNMVLMLIIAFMPGLVFAETHVYVGDKDIYEEAYTDETAIFDNESNTLTLNGYNVIGKVRIPKIEIEYPILDIDTYNPEETKEPMKISIVKSKKDIYHLSRF